MANYDFTYTGAEIQAILDTGKKLKDSGYIFLGVATPSTNPGTPTQKVYYEAKQAGTYTNFGGVVLPDGISLLIWNGSWTSETVMCGDGGVFDISVYKSTGGTLATFADLSAALNGGNNIPVGVRKGGMSVKFVQSSDNKYVQYRLMSDTFNTTVANWQGVDDVPTAESDNLVKSGGIWGSLIFGNSQRIIIDNTSSTWVYLNKPISGLVYIKSNRPIQIAKKANKTQNVIKINTTDGTFVYLDGEYTHFFSDANVSLELEITSVNEKELIGSFNNQIITGWTSGYYNNSGVWTPKSNNYYWVTAKIDVEIGNYYIIPYCSTDSVMSLVNLDSNGNYVSRLEPIIPKRNNDTINTFTVVKALSPKIGLTLYSRIEGFGTSITLDSILKLPYNVLSGNGEINPYSLITVNQIDNIMSLFDFKLTKVTELEGGYFATDGHWEKTNYGNWRTAVFDVEPNQWYLVNCALHPNIRIFDVDENDNAFINSSVPESYYNLVTSDHVSWVLVKAKYERLGVNVVDPANKTDKYNYSYPQYVKLERNNNNGLVFLFLQIYGLLESKNIIDIVVRKAGGADYTSLTQAIMDNRGKDNVVIRIDEGTYNLFDELVEYYGTSDFLPLTPYGRGIELSHDIRLIGSPSAKVVANYTGDDASIKEFFSPFNIECANNVGGASLIGINIECSNVRYCVHDEKKSNRTGTYRNVYDNCTMYIDNTQNDVWTSKQCIGGGLGMAGNIVITNCVFESVGNNYDAISYHNNASAGAKSIITCKDNYIKGNAGFRFSWYGQSTEITKIICTNNNVGNATIFRAETQDTSLYQNMELIDWNNIVRS